MPCFLAGHYANNRPWRNWITQQIPILEIGGSNPFGRANLKGVVSQDTAPFKFFYLTKGFEKGGLPKANCNLPVDGCKARGRVGDVGAEQIPSGGPKKTSLKLDLSFLLFHY